MLMTLMMSGLDMYNADCRIKKIHSCILYVLLEEIT